MIECNICCEEYDNVQKKIFLTCGHNMCSECLLKIRETTDHCPFCRQNLVISKLTYNYMLRYSIYINVPKLFKFVLEKEPTVINTINKYGNTPLHLACKQDRFVKELIDANTTTVCFNNKGKQAIDNLKTTSSSYNLLKTTKRDVKIINNDYHKLYETIVEKNLQNFKKVIISCVIPDSNIINKIIMDETLIDFKNFLKVAGYL